jgi:hypothetical protein
MFSPYKRPTIVEFTDPATGHISAAVSVDSKSLELSEIPALGTAITEIGLPPEYSDKYSADHKLTRISRNDTGEGYTLVFEKLPGSTLSGQVVTEKGELATLTRQIVDPDTEITPSALTVTARLEPDGKGRSILEKIEVPEVFSEQTFSKDTPDPVPEKFRVAIPTETTEETVEGQAAAPTLVTGDIAKSEQQITKFTKRKRTTKRNTAALPKSLVQRATTNEGVKATVTETLRSGDSTENPSATVSIESEAIGDGTFVVRKTELEEVFPGKVFSADRPDPVPEKFRVAVPTKTVEETAAGTAGEPTLVGGEIAESEQQVTKFTKRTRKVTRDTASLPKTLTQTATTNEGLKATVTETLQTGDTTDTPTATKSVESEAIGDGTYVVRTTTLPKVFAGQTFSAERPDRTPEKFRAAIPATTTEETVIGTAGAPTLVGGEIAESEQQVTEHTKRTRKVSRDPATLPKTLSQKATTPEGLLASVSETLRTTDIDGTTETPSATESFESENLGDGTFVVRKTTLPEVFPAKSFSAENPDPVPQKFRIAAPAVTEEETMAGTATAPTPLAPGELAKSEQQVTKFTKRTSKTSRSTTALPKTLTQTATTNEGLKATVTETLQVGDTIDIPSATKIVESEAIGDGTFVVRTTDLPEVFSGKTLAVENPDPVPAKFRTLSPSTTEEETVAGTVQPQFLATGEIAKSEQQVTKHTKRKRKVTRARADLPVKLTQIGTGSERRKKYIEETLQLGDTARDTSPTVSVQSEAMGDGTYLVRTEDDVEIFTGAAFNVEATDPTPQKFRSKLPIRIEERNEVGIAARPELQPGDIARSSQQVDKFNRRRRRTYRAIETLPVTLTQTDTNQQGQKVTVTETLQRGDTSEQPNATLTVQSEALGDGNYVVRRTQIPEVFPENAISLERPDNSPQKFRAALPTTTTEEVVPGQVEEPTLSSGELAASEQQLTAHTKRTRRVSRNASKLPKTLAQTATNAQGQKVTVTETLQVGDTSESPTALSTVESEAIGDGTYIVRKSTVPEVFKAKRVEKQRDEDSLPARFRAAIEKEILEEITAGAVSNTLSLTGNQIAASEEQLTEHTKRRRTVERNIEASSSTLRGQDYDPTFDVTLPYVERITSSGAELGQKSREVTPLSATQDLVREADFSQIQAALGAINLQFPSRSSLTLPPVLKEVKLEWDITEEEGRFNGRGSGTGTGNTWSWSAQARGEARAVAAVMPGWVVDMEEVWASGVPTTSHIFFLPYPVTEADILAKLNVSRWPVFRPESHVLVAFGKKITASRESSSSNSRSQGDGTSSSTSSGDGNSFGSASTAVTLRIPPCLHGAIQIKEEKKAQANASARVSVGEYIGIDGGGNVTTSPAIEANAVATAKAEVKVDYTLQATQPKDIPRTGRYLIDSRVEPYQYGFARCYAEVLDANIFNSALTFL